MDKNKIIKYFQENGFDDIEEIDYKEGVAVLRFFYDFDKDELASAKAYANDECEEEQQSEEWFDEFFLPYLNEIAIDNVGDIIEEIMDNFKIHAQFVTYETDPENYEDCEFVAVFYDKEEDMDIEIEELLDELDL